MSDELDIEDALAEIESSHLEDATRELAADSVAFVAQVWDTLFATGRVDGDFSFQQLGSALDSLNNELAAAVVFLAKLGPQIPELLDAEVAFVQEQLPDLDDQTRAMFESSLSNLRYLVSSTIETAKKLEELHGSLPKNP